MPSASPILHNLTFGTQWYATKNARQLNTRFAAAGIVTVDNLVRQKGSPLRENYWGQCTYQLTSRVGQLPLTDYADTDFVLNFLSGTMSKLEFLRGHADQCRANAQLSSLRKIAELWESIARSYQILIDHEETQIERSTLRS